MKDKNRPENDIFTVHTRKGKAKGPEEEVSLEGFAAEYHPPKKQHAPQAAQKNTPPAGDFSIARRRKEERETVYEEFASELTPKQPARPQPGDAYPPPQEEADMLENTAYFRIKNVSNTQKKPVRPAREQLQEDYAPPNNREEAASLENTGTFRIKSVANTPNKPIPPVREQLQEDYAPPNNREEAASLENTGAFRIKGVRAQTETPAESSLPQTPYQKFRSRVSAFLDKLAARVKKQQKATDAPSSTYFKRAAFNELFTDTPRTPNYFIQLFLTTGKMLIALVLILGFCGLGALLGLAKAYVDSIPDFDFALIQNQDQSSLIYDANGQLLSRYYGTENREWVSIEEIPLQLQNAFIAIEDVRFYRHIGVDFKRLLGSVILNISTDSIQGGSTITQQLIKNTLLSSEQTYKRKMREAYLSIQLENTYDKKIILEAYLNTIPLGGSNYGVKTAAMDFFGKELSELTLLECATLAGLTQSPSRYNPRLNFYTRNRPEVTLNRAKTVLYEMVENGLISLDEYEKAKADTLTVLETAPASATQALQSYYEYAINDVVTHLLEAQSLENNAANRKMMENKLRTEGYRIYTTIDPEKQIAAENAVYNFKKYPNMRYEQDKYTIVGRNADGSVIRLVQPQASSVVIDYRTGKIVAMVGGRQIPTNKKEFNRSYQSSMPIGSSIKPISVYAPAIEKGFGSGTVYWDLPITIKNWGTDKGYPSNNSGNYEGLVSMRTAVVKSLNTTAAQALMYQVGIETSKQALLNMGVSEAHINADGPGLALGSSGLTMLELSAAYATIANMGVYREPISFTKVTDRDGKMIYDMEANQEVRTVFRESTAWIMTDLLYATVNNSGAGKNALVSGQTTYGKTGTNSDFRGVTFAGFTGYYAAAVWIGSDAYKPLPSGTQGSGYAAPLFKDIMTPLHKGLENKKFTDKTAEELDIGKVAFSKVSGRPANGLDTSVTAADYAYLPDAAKYQDASAVQVRICSQSGGIAGSNCPETHAEVLYKFTDYNQLAYMYDLYRANPTEHASFAKYFPKLLSEKANCTMHTDVWQGEEQEKQQMLPAVRQALIAADSKLALGNLDPSQKQSLTALSQSMRAAYDAPTTVTLTEFKNRYELLTAFLDSLGG